MRVGRHRKPQGVLARELVGLFEARRLTNGDVWGLLVGVGYRGCRTEVDNFIAGRRPMPVLMIDAIGKVLGLDDAQVRRLHCAAAMDHGFRVGGLDGQ